jgi:cold shock CspA family protein
LDVLAWFKMYVDSNPKTKNWAKVESTTEVRETDAALIQGRIININLQKGFAFFKPDDKSENVFIPPHLIANHELNEGIPIVVEVENYIDNRTNETKKRVKTLEII